MPGLVGVLTGCIPSLLLYPQTYFEDNPRDLHLLRHDRPLHPAIIKPHLRHVPDYLGTCPCHVAASGWSLGRGLVISGPLGIQPSGLECGGGCCLTQGCHVRC